MNDTRSTCSFISLPYLCINLFYEDKNEIRFALFKKNRRTFQEKSIRCFMNEKEERELLILRNNEKF